MIKCARCPGQRGALILRQIWAKSPTYFFIISTPEVRALVEPVIRCACTHAPMSGLCTIYLLCFALLINFLGLLKKKKGKKEKSWWIFWVWWTWKHQDQALDSKGFVLAMVISQPKVGSILQFFWGTGFNHMICVCGSLWPLVYSIFNIVTLKK
jgi:hypothetical protein